MHVLFKASLFKLLMEIIYLHIYGNCSSWAFSLEGPQSL